MNGNAGERIRTPLDAAELIEVSMGKETVAVIMGDGLFTERPPLAGVEDIISYLMMRESYAQPEDADGELVKRYAVVCKITVEEIE